MTSINILHIIFVIMKAITEIYSKQKYCVKSKNNGIALVLSGISAEIVKLQDALKKCNFIFK